MTKTTSESIFNLIAEGIATLAQTTVKNYVNEAKKDGEKFVKAIRENVINWADLVAEGKLGTEDFEWLLLRQKDLVAMQALKQAGLAQIRIEAFKLSVINLIADSVFSVLKI